MKMKTKYQYRWLRKKRQQGYKTVGWVIPQSICEPLNDYRVFLINNMKPILKIKDANEEIQRLHRVLAENGIDAVSGKKNSEPPIKSDTVSDKVSKPTRFSVKTIQ